MTDRTEFKGWTRSPGLREALFGAVLIVAFIAYGLWNCARADDAVKRYQQTVPLCQEDEIVQGVGDFSLGHWTSYRCEHPDNLKTEWHR